MMLWLLFAAVTAAVLALLVIPLLRRQSAAPARVDYDIVVYRDQLAEVERDVERGMLNADQAEAARNEILRRMLAAEDAELEAPPAEYRQGRRLRLVTAVVIGLGLPIGAFAFYGVLGTPALPGQPYADRANNPDIKMAEMAANLADELKVKPDADGYATLAETYFSLRHYEEAAAAFKRAITLGLIDAQMLASYGESLVMVADGQVGPDAREAFQQAMTLDAKDPRARFYLGLEKAQLGHYAEAVSIWRDLEKDSPAEAPWLSMLKEHIAEYSRQGGFDPASIAPVPPAPAGLKTAAGKANPHAEAPAGTPASATASAPASAPAAASEGVPGGDAAAALMAQSPEERQKTIRSMVDGLAARLEQSPDDFDGWLRLSRSYQSLGDLEKARGAAQHAVGLKPTAVDAQLALAEVQLASAKDDHLPDDFVATMKQVLSLDPTNDEAMYYLGAAEAQAGHPDKARQMWSKLLDTLPQDSPNRPNLIKQIDALPKS